VQPEQHFEAGFSGKIGTAEAGDLHGFSNSIRAQVRTTGLSMRIASRRISRHGTSAGCFALIGLVVTAMLGVQLRAQSPSSGKTAEQAYKNIKVLKSIPADQLIPSMQFVAASLGVECDHCHVAGAFEKDDKKPKQTARKMMEMMLAINANNFENKREVTCNTCHRGHTSPVGIPAIPEASEVQPLPPTQSAKDESAPGAPAPKVSADPILAKYVAALGGATAIQRVKTRVEKGSADIGGKQFPVDIYAESPDKRVSTMHLPSGDSVTAFNGSVGWLSTPGRPTRWMSGPDIEGARFDAEFSLPIRMKEIFSELTVNGSERIDGRDTTLVVGTRSGKPPVKFYFDPNTGLLVRVLRYTDTALGLNPTQIDYADYREVDGVKIPWRWTIARPSGRFTIKLDEVQQNVTIDAAKFAAPAQ